LVSNDLEECSECSYAGVGVEKKDLDSIVTSESISREGGDEKEVV
jgi:hypothetical protein